MPPSAKKKAKKAEKPRSPLEPLDRQRRRHGPLELSGRFYEGAIASRCLRSGMRVAVWTLDAHALEDDPHVCGVLLGILAPRDSGPKLAVAVNGRTEKIDLAEIASMIELSSTEASAGGDERLERS